MRRSFREALLSAGSVVILLMVLIAADDRVRDQISRHAVARPSETVVSAGQEVRDFTTAIVQTARAESFGHTQLLVFALAAGVLTVFMLRT